MTSLFELKPSLLSPAETRLFAEYGAMFVTAATPPPVILFAGARQVAAFQSSLRVSRAVFGEHQIELQASALEALTAAASEASDRGLRISARAADAGRRSYEDTVRLWIRNVTRGLEHWVEIGRISPERALSVRKQSPVEQVATILDLEDTEQLFFGTFFDKSILHSVAAPGASQHLSMLAFDVAEYENREATSLLGHRGWYRTVPDDLPHFTYLGHEETALAGLGLARTLRVHRETSYEFWIPDIEVLSRQRC